LEEYKQDRIRCVYSEQKTLRALQGYRVHEVRLVRACARAASHYLRRKKIQSVHRGGTIASEQGEIDFFRVRDCGRNTYGTFCSEKIIIEGMPGGGKYIVCLT